jgi:hypothetical protein
MAPSLQFALVPGEPGHFAAATRRADSRRPLVDGLSPDVCTNTACPCCGADVVVLRHGRGRVWFDAFAAPWDGHRCFADDGYAVALRAQLRAPLGSRAVGVVTHALRWNDLEYCWISCSDGSEVRRSSRSPLERLAPGDLLVVGPRGRATALVTPDPSVPAAEVQEVACDACRLRVSVAGLPARPGASRILRVVCLRCRSRVPLPAPIGGLLAIDAVAEDSGEGG